MKASEDWRRSIGARVTAMNGMLDQAVADLTLEQVNHRERTGVLSIAFSLAHVVGGQDRNVARLLDKGAMLWESGNWNARVKLTGRKLEQKRYFRHTGYMGHERFAPVKNVLEKRPERVIEKAVWGMLPKTTLSRQKVKQMLKVYAGPEHPHAAQQPEPLSLAEAR